MRSLRRDAVRSSAWVRARSSTSGDPVVAGCTAIRAPAGVVQVRAGRPHGHRRRGHDLRRARRGARRRGPGGRARSPRPGRDGRWRARGRHLGAAAASARSRPRRGARGAVRDRPTAGVVKAGGPTVKNVSGYDLPRLLVGSFGTLGAARAGHAPSPGPTGVDRSGRRVPARPTRCSPPWPSRRRCCGTARTTTRAARGTPRRRRRRAGGRRRARAGRPAPPVSPAGAHRGRISVRPACGRRPRRARSTRRGAAGSRRPESGPCTWRPTSRTALAAARRRRARARAVGCCARPGRPDLDGFGDRAPERSRSCRGSRRASIPTASSRPAACPFASRRGRPRTGVRHDARTSTTTSSSPASRAASACRTARPTG